MNPIPDARTVVEEDSHAAGIKLIDSARTSEDHQGESNSTNAEIQRNKIITPDENLWSQYATTFRDDNSTALRISSENVTSQFQELFSAAKEEVFESGMETSFSRKLLDLINQYNVAAMNAITDFILSGTMNAEVAAETLRWLGLMESDVCYRQRRWLLARSLRAASERVRDAAALGLSYIDDPWAIPYLENAIRDEQILELKHDMEQVLDQLKLTRENS